MRIPAYPSITDALCPRPARWLSARCGSRRRIFFMPKANVVVRASCACLSQLAQLCFRLLRPVGHAHFSVHRDRGGEVPMGLLVIVRAAVKFAETEVAVSGEWAHAELRCLG